MGFIILDTDNNRQATEDSIFNCERLAVESECSKDATANPSLAYVIDLEHSNGTLHVESFLSGQG